MRVEKACIALSVFFIVGCVRPSIVNKNEEKAHVAQLAFRHLKETGACPSSVDAVVVDGVDMAEVKKMLTGRYSISCDRDGRVVVRDVEATDDKGIAYPRSD